MSRSAAQDEQRAVVSVSGVAFALMAMDLPVWMDAPAAWQASDADERNEYMARARWLVDIAESTGEAPSNSLRWGAPDRPSLPETERTPQGLRITRPARPHVVQLGDQVASCTCGRWQFEDDEPEPAKHIDGCDVTRMVGGPGQPAAGA